MAKRCRLEFHDNTLNSHKFWEATVEGVVFSVRYGRVGAKGKVHAHPDFATHAEAVAAYEKRRREQLHQGYKDVTGSTPSPVAGDPRPFTYQIYWKVPAVFGKPISGEMLRSAYGVLLEIRKELGTDRWDVGITDHTVVVSSVDREPVSFGFMPTDDFKRQSLGDRRAHEDRGINGFLSPKGFSEDGGVIETNGTWLDLPVRILLALLRLDNPGLQVSCDLGIQYERPGVHSPGEEHAQKFAWMAEWETIRRVLDERELLGGVDRVTLLLRKAHKSRAEGIVIW